MAHNGPARELKGIDGSGPDMDDETVYCTQCGTVFIRARGRDCPTCALAEKIDQ